ncbi:ribonuclease Z [Bacillus luteolus]|uniref:Ribonuclease Z n=1 Tax=Litchfieldia luteola TaxID=682179 RepID=A0ABR9QPM2_9BACI|nr:ribonuclease Z [Cytobacillus luteolus]MBE4910404.1 ribonuclease Z [Cytobacillus luteolus]MBP1942020.1 ribonuclease Z [Cytobacillus luteolus]
MEIVFLGTGAGVPAKERNVTSIAVQLVEERGATWLFDCGEATQHQILHTSIRPRRIEKIFITHLHGDHIFGLPGLLGSRSFQGGDSLLTIYGPKGIKEFIDVSLRVSSTHLRYPIEVVEIEEGLIFEDEQFSVRAAKLEHGITSYGYRIVEKDLPGTLLVDKLKVENVSPGPIFQRLKAGETVELEDGRKLDGKEFVGPPQKGRIITILGDTRECQNSITLSEDADLLVHEATFSGEEIELAHDYFHSTTKQAATIASKARVKSLILTHISSRYQRESSSQLLSEAKAIFENSYLAQDFMRYSLPRV